jgi:membrane peptidoglycan carboxypeptidase
LAIFSAPMLRAKRTTRMFPTGPAGPARTFRLRWPRRLADAGLRILALPLVIALAALMVAAGLYPAFGGAGVAISRFDKTFSIDQNKALQLPAFPQRSTIVAADGSVLARVADENRVYLPLAKISPLAREAVLSIEDAGFYKHGPVDGLAIVRAALANLKAGRVVQGGSTISQQLIKQTETGDAQTFQRKFREAQEAIRLERQFSKDHILEMYLNLVYFGHGAYGIEAAAEWYFAKSAAKLTLNQAAMLAGLISSPARWDPVTHPALAKSRRNQVLLRMRDLRWISQSEYLDSIHRKVKLKDRLRDVNSLGPQPFFVQYVKDAILHPDLVFDKTDPRRGQYLKLFGKTYAQRRTMLFQGGLRISTTLQPQLQTVAAKAVATHLPNQGKAPPADPEAALVTIVPQTGAIQAMYAGRNFSKSKFNLATQGGRTAGSSFKAFTLVAALENGVPVGKVYDTKTPFEIKDQTCSTNGEPWIPANAEPGTGGFVNMTIATADSINVYFAQLISDVGPDVVEQTAVDMGVRGYARDAHVFIPPYCAITLGAVRVNPLSMTSGYSTLANQGTHCEPFAISRVSDSAGHLLFKARPQCQEVIPPSVAAQVTSLLEGVVKFGTGTAANLGRPVAGKTGTGQEYQDAWFMGYVPQLVTGVWVGYSRAEIPMRALPVLGYANAFGGTIAAPIWHDFMLAAVAGLPVQDFPAPPPPKTGRVPSVVGLDQSAAESVLAKANFTAVSHDVDSTSPKGTVVTQSPGGGSFAILGSAVSIGISTGKAPLTAVPSVVGLSKAAAIARLHAAGFGVTISTRDVGNPSKAGIVLSQSPAAGAQRKPGALVTIVVGVYKPAPSPSPKPSPNPSPSH